MPSAGWCRFARLLAVILCPAAARTTFPSRPRGTQACLPACSAAPSCRPIGGLCCGPAKPRAVLRGGPGAGAVRPPVPGGVVAGAPRSHRGMGCRAAAWREVLSVSAGDVRGSGLGERCGGRGRWGVGGLWRAAGRAWPRGAAAAGISPWGGHALCFALPCLVSIP